MGVPTEVVRTDQAMVSGCVGWTGQAIATGHRKFGGHTEPTARDEGSKSSSSSFEFEFELT